MAVSSGSLGGDDSSKLDELNKSLSENTDKLDSLGKIIDRIEDVDVSSSPIQNVGDTNSQQQSILDKLSGKITDVDGGDITQIISNNGASNNSNNPNSVNILGLAVPIGLLTSNFLKLGQATQQATASLTNLVSSIAQNPLGNTSTTFQTLAAPVKTATNFASNTGSIIGSVIGSLTPLGPILGGPIGSFVGGAIIDTLLAPINLVTDTLISINDSVSQIADDLVGFSPEVTGAVLGREIAVLRDDFRRASQVGPEIARITEAQTRLQLASRQAFDSLLRATEPYLVTALNVLTSITSKIDFGIRILEILAENIPPLNAALNIIKGAAVGINLTVEDIAKDLGIDDPLELDSLANQTFGPEFSKLNPGASVQLR